MACHGIEDVNKVKFLIASVGAKVYSKLRLLAVPKSPTELTFAETRKLLQAEYVRTPLVHVAQHTFRQRMQKEGESFRDFYNALKELSRDCGFASTDRLKEELKAQIISGIRDRKTQSYYFMSKNLSLDEVVAKAEVDELAVNSIDHFRKPADSKVDASINKITDPVRRKNAFQKKPNRFRRGSTPHPNQSLTSSASASTGGSVICYRCAKPGHKAPSCHYRNATCNKCQRTGHIAAACGKARESFRPSSYQPPAATGVNQLEPYEIVPIHTLREQYFEIVEMNSLQNRGSIGVNDPTKKVMVELQIEGKPAKFEADSGSKYAVMSKADFDRLGLSKELHPCFIVLQTYSHDYINVIGCIYVNVSYKSRFARDLRLLLVDGNYDAVFGREWLFALNIALVFGPTTACINALPHVSFELEPALKKLATDFNDLFLECFSILKNIVFNVTLKNGSNPIFCRHRNIVYALRDVVDREIDRLVDSKIYEPVESSDWATPIVIVQKSNGTVRLVGDYSVTINTCIVPEDYPIPNIEEILYDFRCCKYYSKFDVREAYMHMPVTEETAKLLTVNTPRGLFKVNRMNYGVQSAPAKWQRYVETVFKPVAGCRCFYDDIKISSEEPYAHLARVKQFFEICRENGIKLRKEKCQLLTDELEYLGFKVNAQGVHKTPGKVTAILSAPAPRNLTEVKSFSGLVGFYSRFVPNMSVLFHPINCLLRKDVPFVWSKDCQTAFEAIKREIASPRVLCHFDPRKKLILATDASPYAIGAVLSHEFSEGERPIAFASRALSKAEQNYSQIDKESLAIFWGVKRFFNYLFARRFTLYVDCKPLQAIFAKNVAKPALSATRLLHYAIFLQGFDYEIKYRRSGDHGNADFLSRFPVEVTEMHQIDEPTVLNLHQICMLPVSIDELADETAKDAETAPLLQKLRQADQGSLTDAEFCSLANYSLEKGCILVGTRVFVPRKFRNAILQELHIGHLGISKMKGLARGYVYWPKIDEAIERIVRLCKPCQANANAVFVPAHPWMQPSAPWERVHIDYAGPFMQHSFLIVVDAYSKWPEVFAVPSARFHGTDSTATIEKLTECFARFGCPVTLVSDNGVQFTSAEFRAFCKRNFIKQMHSAPYFPQSNGQAERFVQTIKRALKIAVLENPTEPLPRKLQTFLMAYRRAPVIGTGKSPSQLMLNRSIRTRIDILSSASEKREPDITIGDEGIAVWFKVFQNSKNWEQGTIVQRVGDVMVDVKDNSGKIHRRHKSQIRTDHTTGSQPQNSASTADSEWPITIPAPTVEPDAEDLPPQLEVVANQDAANVEVPHIPPQEPPVATRRSNRERHAPARFSP